VAGAVSDGLLDEGDEVSEIFDDLLEVARFEVVNELWDEGNEGVDVLETLAHIVALEFWEGAGGAVFGDLLEGANELHNVTEDSGDITS